MNGDPLRILIVDDSAFARRAVHVCVSGTAPAQELSFAEAAHGAQALEILRERPFDLVITDLNMPVMDGEQLCANIRADRRLSRVRVLVISSIMNPAVEARLRSAGADAVLLKPVTGPKMQAVVKLLERRAS